MKTRRIISTALMLVMLITLSINVSAGDKPVTVYLDGNQLEFDVNPIIDNGRTLVPMRKIFESLGATVDWIDETRTAIAVKGDIKIEISIGKYEMFINSKSVPLDVPAQLIDGRTLVPARAVSEGLKAKVDWNEDLWRVIITSKEGAEVEKDVYDIRELHPTDKEKLIKDEYSYRYAYEQIMLPEQIHPVSKELAFLIDKKDSAVFDIPNLTWDLFWAAGILATQDNSEYTYNLEEVNTLKDEKKSIEIYGGLLKELGVNSAANFEVSFDMTPKRKTVLLIDFYRTEFDAPLVMVSKYIAIVPDGGRCRYFTAEISPLDLSDAQEGDWILGEIKETGRGNYGVIKENTKTAFFDKIDGVIDEEADTRFTIFGK